MLHPSYSDLINAVNSEVEPGEQPVVQSRYSIVIAAAKRARQLIAGEEAYVENTEGKKPLSVAIEELYTQKVHVMGEDMEEEEAAEEAAEETEEVLEEAAETEEVSEEE